MKFPADLATFAAEIINGKSHFLCSMRLAAECFIVLSLSFMGLTSAICFRLYKEQYKQLFGEKFPVTREVSTP